MASARSWSLRVATPEDAASVSALLARSYPTIWEGHYDAATIEAVRPFVTRANPKLLASGTFFVAIAHEGSAVGCGGWTLEEPGTGNIAAGIGHIRHFATDPDWLRLGIGAAMLKRCISEAKAAGVEILMADSALGAESFYAAFGFEVEAPSAPLIGETPLAGTMMRRALI